ncbi:MAG: DHH family phosphoesterase [Opitutaceae bacterium]
MAEYFPGLSSRLRELLGALSGRPVAVCGHARPDGDCIGSQVALARVLASLGHEVICVNPDAVPRRLEYLARSTPFRPFEETLRCPREWSAVFVDCADHARGGERLKARFSSPAGVIDHHLSNQGFGAVNLIDTAAAATCEILAGVLIDGDFTIDASAAKALYAGILTDTGQFRFGATSRRCFELAGELVARGANPAEAGFELYERETIGKLRLLREFLASLRLECGGRVCVGTLPAGIFSATGATAEDTEGLVDYARCIDGVEIAALVEERADGTFKASLRAKDKSARVDRIAAGFGGGGHACAAGLHLKRDTAGFYARLVAAMAESLARVDAERKS